VPEPDAYKRPTDGKIKGAARPRRECLSALAFNGAVGWLACHGRCKPQQ
jgi:hypothetical protein